MSKRKNKNILNQNEKNLRQIGDVRFDQNFDNSSHLTNAEFARDFEECCDVEFGRDFENNNYINDQFGEENLRRNNLGVSREFEPRNNRSKR